MTITRIQLRRDVAADWTAANPVLAAGEVGLETDTGRMKVGDGATAWNSLTEAFAGKIDKSTLDANTLLGATADNTPIAFPVAASRHVGRKASGDIDDLTPAESAAILAGNVLGIGGAMTSMFRSGMYTTPPHTTRTTGAPAVGTLFYVPLRVGRAITLDRIGIEVTATIATGLIRLGIYADTGADAPGALLVDAGTVSGSAATGLVLATISQALAVPGLYWLAAVTQTAAATLRATGAYLDHVASTAAEVVGATVNAKSYVEAGVTGALPATATPGAVNLGPPLVIVRAA